MKKRIILTSAFALAAVLYLFHLHAGVTCYTLPSYTVGDWIVEEPDYPCSQWRNVQNWGCIGDGHSGGSACEDRKQKIYQIRNGYTKPGGGCEGWSYEGDVMCAADATPCGH